MDVRTGERIANALEAIAKGSNPEDGRASLLIQALGGIQHALDRQTSAIAALSQQIDELGVELHKLPR